MNKYGDIDIYAILPEDFRFDDCYYCLCHMCFYLRKVCKNCYLCEFSANIRKRCVYFLPKVFEDPDLFDWFHAQELVRRYNRKFDYFDFNG